jgi:hypothetical protein
MFMKYIDAWTFLAALPRAFFRAVHWRLDKSRTAGNTQLVFNVDLLFI